MLDEHPQSGDLVVRVGKHSAHAFVVSRTGEHPQFSTATSAEAIDRAKRSAVKQLVDVWYCADGLSCVCVAEYRQLPEPLRLMH